MVGLSRLSTAINDQNRNLFDNNIRRNRRITISEIEDILQMSYDSVQSIIHELDYRRVCAKRVPRHLTPDLKSRLMDACTQLLEV